MAYDVEGVYKKAKYFENKLANQKLIFFELLALNCPFLH